jgi:hypothetical protein
METSVPRPGRTGSISSLSSTEYSSDAEKSVSCTSSDNDRISQHTELDEGDDRDIKEEEHLLVKEMEDLSAQTSPPESNMVSAGIWMVINTLATVAIVSPKLLKA